MQHIRLKAKLKTLIQRLRIVNNLICIPFYKVIAIRFFYFEHMQENDNLPNIEIEDQKIIENIQLNIWEAHTPMIALVIMLFSMPLVTTR